MLEHEDRGMPPRRPRMCATCGRLREIVTFPGPGELVCVECGATSTDGRGWRAELAPDDAGNDEPEVPVYCPACWEREFCGEDVTH